jgi:putative ABC transport system permease protein
MSPLHTIDLGCGACSDILLRSLSTLGILFGVAAVISTVGIGQASSDSVTERISSLGTNLLTIAPGSTLTGGVFGGGGSANTLTMDDVAGLMDRQNAPDIAAVAPVSQGRVSLVSASSNWSTTVSGSTPDWLVANSRTIGSGSFITPSDVSTQAQVIVLAPRPPRTSVLRSISAHRQAIPFRSSESWRPGSRASAARTTCGSDHHGQSELVGGVGSGSDQLSATSQSTIRWPTRNEPGAPQTHHISNRAWPTARSISSTNEHRAATQTLTILLASVGHLTLVGIGVMNIMWSRSRRDRRDQIAPRRLPRRAFSSVRHRAGVLTAVGGLLGRDGSRGLHRAADRNIAISIRRCPC